MGSIKPKTLKTCANTKCGKVFNPMTTLQKCCSFKCQVIYLGKKGKLTWRKGNHTTTIKPKVSESDLIFQENREILIANVKKKYGKLVCERCLKPNCGIRFHTHHIIYRSEKPKHPEIHNLKNLIHLGQPCHDWYHSKKSNRNGLVEKRKLNLLFGNDVLDK